MFGVQCDSIGEHIYVGCIKNPSPGLQGVEEATVWIAGSYISKEKNKFICHIILNRAIVVMNVMTELSIIPPGG